MSEILVDPLLLPAALVNRNGVGCGRNGRPCAKGSHLFGKDKVDGVGKDAAIDMSARHITQAVCTLNGRNPADNVHGHCHRPALCTVTDLQIPICQHQLVQRKGINGNLHLIGDDCIPCKACAAGMGQCLIVCLVQAEHRDRGLKDMGGHQCAKRQNIFLLVKNQGCWRRAIQGKLQQHATAAA